MNAMPRATDSQAVLAVVTWMNAYQLLPCAVRIGCHTAGMTTPNRPQAIRPAGARVSSQPTRMSTVLHSRLRQVSGSAIREPNRAQKLACRSAGRAATAKSPAIRGRALASRSRMARRLIAVSGRPTPTGMRATAISSTAHSTRLATVNPNRTPPGRGSTAACPVPGAGLVHRDRCVHDLLLWLAVGAAGQVPAPVAEQGHD